MPDLCGKASHGRTPSHRRGPAESVFDGGIGVFCNHKYETCNKLD